MKAEVGVGGRVGGLPLSLPSSREAQNLQNHRSFGTGMIFGVYPVWFPDALLRKLEGQRVINLRVPQLVLVPF